MAKKHSNPKTVRRAKAAPSGVKKKRPTKPGSPSAKQTAHKLEQVSRQFDAAVDSLRGKLDAVGECLYDLLAAEAERECRRRFTRLAETGVLHDLQTLAAALEAPPEEQFPSALEGVDRYAALAVTQITRTFDAHPVHKLGEELTVTEEQQAAFDWSADTSGDRTFPMAVTVLRSGWRIGTDVLVKPKVTRATG